MAPVETGGKRTRAAAFFAARAEPSRTGFMCLNGAKNGRCRTHATRHRHVEYRFSNLLTRLAGPPARSQTGQQYHDEPGRLRVAGIPPHDVNIGGPLIERLPCLERDGRLA